VTSNLKGLTFSEDSGTVTAEVGNTWEDVYVYTEAYGRLAVGARHSTVGLATVTGVCNRMILLGIHQVLSYWKAVFHTSLTDTGSPQTISYRSSS
jgi:hypothetical protein